MSIALLQHVAEALPPGSLPAADASRACKHHLLRRAFALLAAQRNLDPAAPLPLPAPALPLRDTPLALSALGEVEDLGRLHESLIDAEVAWEDGGWRVVRRGRRRHSGSHYTPPALALRVTEQAIRTHGGDIQRICDPAVGAGAFLLAAARLLPRAALFGVDIDADAVAVARMSLWLELRPDATPAEFLAEQLVVRDALTESGPDEGFDLVLGNPPYVPFYGRGSQASRFPKGYPDQLRALHGTIDGREVIGGRLNLFLPFCVRATSLLAPDGVAALVLPDTVLTNASFAPLREALSRSGRLRAAVRHGDGVFSGATVGTAVVVWGAPRGEGTASLSEAGARPVDEDVGTLCDRPGATWLPLSTAELRARTISGPGLVALGEIALVKDGLNTGSKRMRERLLCAEPDGDPTLRRCIEGRCIQPFRLKPGRLWVRYDPSLLRGGREGASLGRPEVFDAPKIVYRQTAAHPIAAVDLEGLCYRNSAHGVVLHEHDEGVLWALCGYLNSAAVRIHHRTVTGETRRTFPQVHVASMKRLPVPRQLLEPHEPAVAALAAAARRADLEGVDAAVAALLARGK